MRVFLILSMVFLSGCINAEQIKKECLFSFEQKESCVSKGIEVELVSDKIANDEINLKYLKVSRDGNEYLLNISKDTNLIDGDKGIILLQDINFDSYPDIAISTSFGLSNLYMDYWVYDLASKKFNYVGNFTRFSINKKNKNLSNTVKTNAHKFEDSIYKWKGMKLIKSN